MQLGLTVTGDAFLHKLDAVFSNLDIYTGIAYDMIVWEEKPDGSDHDKHLTEFLQVTRKHHLKPNISKPQYKNKYASSFGDHFHI